MIPLFLIAIDEEELDDDHDGLFQSCDFIIQNKRRAHPAQQGSQSNEYFRIDYIFQIDSQDPECFSILSNL